MPMLPGNSQLWRGYRRQVAGDCKDADGRPRESIADKERPMRPLTLFGFVGLSLSLANGSAIAEEPAALPQLNSSGQPTVPAQPTTPTPPKPPTTPPQPIATPPTTPPLTTAQLTL